MRIIIYTGKGGVGKTSISAATACKIADSGKKVLIMSTDAAHSLSDSFDIKLNNEPTKINQNLYGMEIDTVLENEKVWGNLKGYMDKLLSLKGGNSIESEELLVFPGFEELMSLIKIKEIYDKNEYDVLIVDCAPTGETMSLLKFPEMFKFWMDKVFPFKRKASKIAKPIVENTIKIPMPDDKVFDDIENLYGKLDELHGLMMNKEIVSLRIVTTPEKIVVKEAKRSFSYLHLFDYNVDAIIINKIFPEESLEGYFNPWREIQKETIKEIYESFKDIPIFKVNLMNNKLRRYENLIKAGNSIYDGIKPEDILFKRTIFKIKKCEAGYNLSINMPFIDKSELDLCQDGDEISISVKNEKRSFMLPGNLKSKEIVSAKYEDGNLNIHFQ